MLLAPESAGSAPGAVVRSGAQYGLDLFVEFMKCPWLLLTFVYELLVGVLLRMRGMVEFCMVGTE